MVCDKGSIQLGCYPLNAQWCIRIMEICYRFRVDKKTSLRNDGKVALKPFPEYIFRFTNRKKITIIQNKHISDMFDGTRRGNPRNRWRYRNVRNKGTGVLHDTVRLGFVLVNLPSNFNRKSNFTPP